MSIQADVIHITQELKFHPDPINEGGRFEWNDGDFYLELKHLAALGKLRLFSIEATGADLQSLSLAGNLNVGGDAGSATIAKTGDGDLVIKSYNNKDLHIYNNVNKIATISPNGDIYQISKALGGSFWRKKFEASATLSGASRTIQVDMYRYCVIIGFQFAYQIYRQSCRNQDYRRDRYCNNTRYRHV
jgi:hypothetical protein